MRPTCTKYSKGELLPLEEKKKWKNPMNQHGLVVSAYPVTNITYTTYVGANKSTMIASPW